MPVYGYKQGNVKAYKNVATLNRQKAFYLGNRLTYSQLSFKELIDLRQYLKKEDIVQYGLLKTIKKMIFIQETKPKSRGSKRKK